MSKLIDELLDKIAEKAAEKIADYVIKKDIINNPDNPFIPKNRDWCDNIAVAYGVGFSPYQYITDISTKVESSSAIITPVNGKEDKK